MGIKLEKRIVEETHGYTRSAMDGSTPETFHGYPRSPNFNWTGYISKLDDPITNGNPLGVQNVLEPIEGGTPNANVDVDTNVTLDNITEQNRVERILQKIVPEKIKEHNPKFLEFVRTFLDHIKTSIHYADTNFIDLIDIDRLSNDEIIKIYLDTYVSTLDLSSTSTFKDVRLAKDVIGISHDIVNNKANAFAYKILLSIISYLTSVSTPYQELLNDLDKPTTSPERRREIVKQIDRQRHMNNGVMVEIKEDPSKPFQYKMITTAPITFLDKHIVPFIHPIGWAYDLRRLFRIILEDDEVGSNPFTMDTEVEVSVALKLPEPEADDYANVTDIFDRLSVVRANSADWKHNIATNEVLTKLKTRCIHPDRFRLSEGGYEYIYSNSKYVALLATEDGTREVNGKNQKNYLYATSDKVKGNELDYLFRSGGVIIPRAEDSGYDTSEILPNVVLTPGKTNEASHVKIKYLKEEDV